MNFRELTYVIAIAKYQSVTLAAQKLYVSQPTLSKFVQRLEKELGQPLFRRLGNKFLLTYAGERYVEKASFILLQKKQLDQELSDIKKENIGDLRVAFPVSRSTYILPCTLPAFHKQFPLVNVKVHEADSSTLENFILSGEIDLAFFNLPIICTDIDYEIISREELVLIMSPDHPLASKGIYLNGCKYPWMDIKLLKNERFILQTPNQRARQIADKVFKESAIDPNIVLCTQSIIASVELAISGYGICFATELQLNHIKTDVQPVRFSIGYPSAVTSFVAAFRKGIYLPYHTRAFIEIVRSFT